MAEFTPGDFGSAARRSPTPASLGALTSNAEVPEVFAFGMIIPCFTWAVQLSSSALLLPPHLRRLSWGDLGRVCLIGSVALLPAAVVNFGTVDPPRWVSAANVLVSVAIMAAELFRRSTRHGISPVWPSSWCLMIAVNMLLFLWASAHWW